MQSFGAYWNVTLPCGLNSDLKYWGPYLKSIWIECLKANMSFSVLILFKNDQFTIGKGASAWKDVIVLLDIVQTFYKFILDAISKHTQASTFSWLICSWLIFYPPTASTKGSRLPAVDDMYTVHLFEWEMGNRARTRVASVPSQLSC